MIKAVIFDMDGVLIDSEPFWKQAEVEIYPSVGLHLTHTDCMQTMGMRIDKAVEFWYQRQPWSMPPTIDDIRQQIVDRVTELIGEQGQPMTGVGEALAWIRQRQLPIAIASSSDLSMIEAVVAKLAIQDYFHLLYSAEFEPYGKPHPGVYLTAAAKLGVAPTDCLVIEDSMRGILAAKAAEMRCVAVPDPSLHGDPRLSIADWVLPSLDHLPTIFKE